MTASTTDLAWAAGFIDGEGYIGVHRVYSRNKERKDATCVRGVPTPFLRKPSFELSLQVTQRNRAPLERLQVLFGGAVRARSATNYPQGKYSEWGLQSDHALRVLELVLPYLVGKRAVAEVAVEFGRWYAATRVPGARMSDERRLRATAYAETTQSLNRLHRDVTERAVRGRFTPDENGHVTDDGSLLYTPTALGISRGSKARG